MQLTLLDINNNSIQFLYQSVCNNYNYNNNNNNNKK
jgi:hypothetical protein